MQVQAPGFLPVAFDLGPVVRSTELPSVRCPAARATTVRVTTSRGAAVAGAELWVEPGTGDLGVARPPGVPWTSPWRPATVHATTGRTGTATLWLRVPARLTVVADGLAPASVDLASETARFPVRLVPGRRFVLEARSADGHPLAGVAVEQDGSGTARTTDAQGHLELHAPPGEHPRVRLLAGDGSWAAGSLPSATSPPADAAGDRQAATRFVLSAPVRWIGRSVDARSAAPVAGTLVWPAAYPSLATLSDDAGTFSLAVPFSTQSRLGAAAPGYLQTLGEADPARSRSVRLALQPATAVHGRVVDRDGRPVAAAELQAAPAGRAGASATTARWARTDARGVFEVKALTADARYWLRTAATGFVPVRTAVQAPSAGAGGPYHLILARGVLGAGRVLDSAERPIAGATILALPSSQSHDSGAVVAAREALARSATGADGRFRLPLLPPAPIDLLVTAAGYAPVSVRGLDLSTSPSGAASWEPFDLGTIVLGQGVPIAGWVHDPSGQPIAAARVRIVEPGDSALWQAAEVPPGAASTAEDGTFSIDHVAPGSSVALQVSRRGYSTRTVRVTATAPGEQIDVELPWTASLSGTVRDEYGDPIARALVFASHPAADQAFGDARRRGGGGATDDDGRFTLVGLDPGTLRVVATAPGYLAGETTATLSAAEPVEEVDLVLPSGATLEGTVTDRTGRPIEGARIEVDDNGSDAAIARLERPSTTSDPDGHYRLEGVAPGARTVLARHPAYVLLRRGTQVQSGVNGLDLQLRSGVGVTGLVADGDGRAVAGAQVSLVSDDGSPAPAPVLSGADGRFRFDGVAPGAYHLLGEREGFAPARSDAPVDVAETDVSGAVLTLGRGGSVEGRILGLDPSQLAQVQVTARATGLPGSLGTVRYDGGYRISGLSPGRWTITARTAALGREATGHVTVGTGGGEAVLDLELASGYSLTGTVTRAGRPLAGALVVSRSAAGAAGGSVTDGGGRFRIDDLAAGDYLLTVLDRAKGDQRQVPVTVDGDHDLSIDLSRPQRAPTGTQDQERLPPP